ALDAAIVLQDWPHADLWPILIGEAHAVPSANRRRLHHPDSAKAAALWLADCAESIAGEVEYRE
ncbi:MAG: glycosyltransferase, partial [Sphingobium sp.]